MRVPAVELLRPISLREIMRSFKLQELAVLLHRIEIMHRYAQHQCDTGHRDELMPEEKLEQYIRKQILGKAKEYAELIQLDSTKKRVNDAGPFHIVASLGVTHQNLAHELEVLRESIEADLGDHQFYFLATPDVKTAGEMSASWKNFSEVVPGAEWEGNEAISCYVLNRSTATVFHSMRAAEHGLRVLAKKLRVSSALRHKNQIVPIEYADWQKVITAIKNKLDDIGKIRVGPKRQALLEKYSDAADHCIYMKDIWRNNISHSRKPYKKVEGDRTDLLYQVEC
ncbi:MAG: hypothetical protein WA609_12140 [Terriglobales bacterium]